ncbi:MAG: ABC transporter substrate-binding protein, partial [Acidimicrobiia bacterium]|nr:ABC transporter substrate-binding protein [Acidimicrobiia bacterium]
MRRLMILLALLASFAVVAASCGDDAETVGAESDATTTEATDPPETTADSDDGTDDDEEMVDEDAIVGTIKIGAALSETGKYSVEGKDSRQGYDTWAKWVNEDYGGISLPDGRYEVEVVYYDDESDAETASNLTQKLIDEDEVQF